MLSTSPLASGQPETFTVSIAEEEAERVNDNVLPWQSDADILPVVGLGGSAGSIRALQEFFARVPSNLGMAFVVVIHLSPDHESSLHQIIQARTSMPVVQVTDAVTVEANHVYVIPPSYHLSMQEGQIHLSEPEQAKGARVAVDLFFRTLAASQRTKAVAVVLSGTDGDGSLGIKRIKEYGGLTIAQDPTQAEQEGMPRSAIETGMVDWILPVEQIAAKLGEWINNEGKIRLPVPESVEETDPEATDADALREVLTFLHAHTGHDFSHYKSATVLRRIGRRLQVNSLENLLQYAVYLRTHPSEARALLQDLLISVTNFFRDAAAFGSLEIHLSHLFEGKKVGDTVRVWVAGCATGEEAYTLAMLLIEHASSLASAPEIQVFATDLDEHALQVARTGIYPASIIADVSPERLQRFFLPDQGGYRIKKEVRERILFAPHNLLSDAPFSRLDLISCRNLLIYFNREAQRRVIELFHFALRPEGVLFLGGSETVDDEILFQSLERKHSLYLKQTVAQHHYFPPPLLSPPTPRLPPVSTLKQVASQSGISLWPMVAREETAVSASELHQQLAAHIAPPSILVNSNGDMLHLANNAGRYLKFGEGGIANSNNLLFVVSPALRIELRVALFSALQTGDETELAPIALELDGAMHQVSVRVHPQPGTGENLSAVALVTFNETRAETDQIVPRSSVSQDEAMQLLESELQHLKTYLRTAIEAYEVTSEELKAYNEELQSINEEQHSAAEELETSREEIQAANEELTTLNGELKSKIEELGSANSDLQNLMSSTDIATIFQDRQGRIKRFTPRAQELFRLLPGDLGRPLSDLKHGFETERYIEDAQDVLRRLVPVEREVRTQDGHWFLSRISPYRTLEDQIDGVVLTFVDITERKQAEEAKFFLASIVESSQDAIITVNLEGVITSWNASAETLFGHSAPSVTGKPLAMLTIPADMGKVMSHIDEIKHSQEVKTFETPLLSQEGTPMYMEVVLSPVKDEAERIIGVSAILRDITARREAEDILRRSHEELEGHITTRTHELEQVLGQVQTEVRQRRQVEAERAELMKRIVTTQEQERGRISRDLHDNLGQYLTGMMLGLQALEAQVNSLNGDNKAEATSQLDKLRPLVDGLMKAAHRQAWELRPAELDAMGVEVALQQYVSDWSARTGVAVDTQSSGWEEGRLDTAIETTLYRVVQEALTNVARHAEATYVSIVLELSSTMASAIVEDNGRGFDTEAKTARLGVVGMRERLAIVGGTLDIESSIGESTTVFARVPLENFKQGTSSEEGEIA